MRARVLLPLLALLGLSACVETIDVEIGSSRHLEELITETAETEALREHAFSTWADVGVETPGDYRVGLLPIAELQAACETQPDHVVGGCEFHRERVILIASDVSPWAKQWLMVHEVGHLTHGHNGHLQCDRTGKGPDIMCANSVGSALTARDIDFALSETP